MDETEKAKVQWCTDFELPPAAHCSSCHQDWDEGYSPNEVYQSDLDEGGYRREDPLLALTCCNTYDLVLEKLHGEIVERVEEE